MGPMLLPFKVDTKILLLPKGSGFGPEVMFKQNPYFNFLVYAT